MNDFHSVYGTPKSIPSAFKSQVFMYSEINDARLMRDTSDLDKAHVVTSMIFASDLHKPVLPGITRENQKMSYKGSKYYTYTDPVTGKKTFFNTAKERDRYAAQQREKRSKR